MKSIKLKHTTGTGKHSTGAFSQPIFHARADLETFNKRQAPVQGACSSPIQSSISIYCYESTEYRVCSIIRSQQSPRTLILSCFSCLQQLMQHRRHQFQG